MMSKREESKNSNSSELCGIPLSASPLVIAELYDQSLDSFLIVTTNDVSAKYNQEILSNLIPTAKIVYFPAWDCMAYDRSSPKKKIIGERLRSLSEICQNKDGERIIVITTVNSLLTRVIPAEVIAGNHLNLHLGKKLKQDDLTAFLSVNGYNFTSNVTDVGEYTVKGSIVDIFPIDHDNPIRVDFFAGDEIDSIKIFDPFTQLTLSKIDDITLIQAGELILNHETIDCFKDNIRADYPYEITEEVFYESTISGIYYPAIEHLLPLFFPKLAKFTDYISNYKIILDHNVEEAVAERLAEIDDHYTARLNYLKTLAKESFIALPPSSLYWSQDEFCALLQEHENIKLSLFSARKENAQELQFTTVPDFFKEAKVKNKTATTLFLEYAHARIIAEKKVKIVIAAFNEYSKERIEKLFNEHDVSLKSVDNLTDIKADIVPHIIVLKVDKGFSFKDLTIISEQDLLGSKIQRITAKKKRADKLILEAGSLDIDEYIVHSEHGIGQFKGLQNITIKDVMHDFLVIQYDGNDKLYVPVQNIDLVTRYGGNIEGAKLDKLGSLNWQERKARLKKKIREIASDLMQVASLRELKEAKSYVADSMLQEEFNAGFGYNETIDQERAIADVVGDLESGKPMDRLICGDVGFGKTEVAMRAAFTVISNNKNKAKAQIAIIAPTTLLARQHYKNFLERFSDFGVEVAQLSRLVTATKKKEVKQGLAKGEIDIVVGTHALLAKDISFANLALVIVDEEQRFGVVQKENLKKLRANVHLLTLSATPIPRTLQMSLAGIRDLSLIATPPVDRMAVRSFVMPFDDVVIREAILREFHRNGKIYVVCPRIKDLKKLEEKLGKIVPEIKLVVAHGQMNSNELDKIMTDFCDGVYNLLLATTIIESGIDIPEANTLIIYNSDMFALSTLYQLRGRVGRSKVRAYTYFTVDERKILNKNAKKRLEVMQTLDGLGAGFTLASYDLDIRGAGNLLGEEQSGHIKEVGVELYQKMLQDELELQRSGVKTDDLEIEKDTSFSPTVNLGVSVRIPEKYIIDLGSRIEFYRRIAEAITEEEARQIAYEMEDRFGKLPVDVNNLFAIVGIKQKCKELNILKLDAGEKGMVIKFHENNFHNPDKLIEYISQNPLRIKIRPDQKITIKYGAIGNNFLISEINKALDKIANL